MKIYKESYCWRVHIRNFDDFIMYIRNRFGKFSTSDMYGFKNFYDGDYIYLYVDLTDINSLYTLTYTSNHISHVVEDGLCDYMGEFLNRRNKLEKLNIISNS